MRLTLSLSLRSRGQIFTVALVARAPSSSHARSHSLATAGAAAQRALALLSLERRAPPRSRSSSLQRRARTCARAQGRVGCYSSPSLYLFPDAGWKVSCVCVCARAGEREGEREDLSERSALHTALSEGGAHALCRKKENNTHCTQDSVSRRRRRRRTVVHRAALSSRDVPGVVRAARPCAVPPLSRACAAVIPPARASLVLPLFLSLYMIVSLPLSRACLCVFCLAPTLDAARARSLLFPLSSGRAWSYFLAPVCVCVSERGSACAPALTHGLHVYRYARVPDTPFYTLSLLLLTPALLRSLAREALTLLSRSLAPGSVLLNRWQPSLYLKHLLSRRPARAEREWIWI